MNHLPYKFGLLCSVLYGWVPVAKPQISIIFMSSLDSNLWRALGCLWMKDNILNCKSLLLHLGRVCSGILEIKSCYIISRWLYPIMSLVALLQCDWVFLCILTLIFLPHPFASCVFVCLWRDGTTDVTRTMHFGTPSAYEKVIWHLSVACDLTLIIRDT